ESIVINYNLSEYGTIDNTVQYDDGTILICSSKLGEININLIYPNGSKFSVNYEKVINFKNASSWRYFECYPLATNYIFLLYYNRSDQRIDTTIRGTIINVNDEPTTNNGIANPISNGSFKPPLEGFGFRSQEIFAKIDGQHAIVYTIANTTDQPFDITTNYNYPRFSVYVHFVKDSMDQQSEQLLLYRYYGSSTLSVVLTDCQANLTH
ncbi:11073_t:CDS:2, partial [Dentiscutata heterogama]